jgi:DNA-directed RNA polymerase specialized sigma24 family protein
LAVALAALPSVEQQVLIWSYFGHRTQQQIADQLSIPRSVVARAAVQGLAAVSRYLDIVDTDDQPWTLTA